MKLCTERAGFPSTVASYMLLPCSRGIQHGGRVLTVNGLTQSPMFLKLSSSKEENQQVQKKREEKGTTTRRVKLDNFFPFHIYSVRYPPFPPPPPRPYPFDQCNSSETSTDLCIELQEFRLGKRTGENGVR